MAGLRSIVLHHSYLHGIRTRIECYDHTMLYGSNGVGKTSLLHLIPVFLGIEPRRIMERGAGKKSFADYYLPNMQSMILYEYERLDGVICCAVIYRPAGQADYAYRFIEGSADDTLYHPV